MSNLCYADHKIMLRALKSIKEALEKGQTEMALDMAKDVLEAIDTTEPDYEKCCGQKS